MPFRTEEMEEPALNLTPMLDVVLNLVIFFMLGTQFTRPESQYDVQLPSVTEARPLTAGPDALIINVRKDGTLLLGAQPRTLPELEADLREARARFANQMVLVRGDAAVEYQHIMNVLNACRRAQIVNFQLANRIERGRGG